MCTYVGMKEWDGGDGEQQFGVWCQSLRDRLLNSRYGIGKGRSGMKMDGTEIPICEMKTKFIMSCAIIVFQSTLLKNELYLPFGVRMRRSCFLAENVEYCTRSFRHGVCPCCIFWNNWRFIRKWKDWTERCCLLFGQFHPVITSYTTVVKYQNQRILSGTTRAYFFVILSRVYISNYHHGQDPEPLFH